MRRRIGRFASTCWRCSPTPWGLVRSGVAPDHPKIKSISAQFAKTSANPRFRFFGNITVGEHVQAAELAQRYDAVVYAVGAQSDRAWASPGEDLPGSVAAVDFVGWYNAHPHFQGIAPDLNAQRAVVIGNGNVALDVARILISDPEILAQTDIADHALDSLGVRGVQEVIVVGRRGPVQAPPSRRWNYASWATWNRWPRWTSWWTEPTSTPSPTRSWRRPARPSSRT